MKVGVVSYERDDNKNIGKKKRKKKRLRFLLHFV